MISNVRAEQANVLGTERMVLVVGGGDRVVRFRGDGPFVLQESTLPALADQLNRIAAATSGDGR